MATTCKYLGAGKFRVTGPGYKVIVQLRSEVDDVEEGDIHVRPRDSEDLTFDEVNQAAMKCIERQLERLAKGAV